MMYLSQVVKNNKIIFNEVFYPSATGFFGRTTLLGKLFLFPVVAVVLLACFCLLHVTLYFVSFVEVYGASIASGVEGVFVLIYHLFIMEKKG